MRSLVYKQWPVSLMSLPWGMSLSLKAESGLILSVGPTMLITGSGTQHITVCLKDCTLENAEHTVRNSWRMQNTHNEKLRKTLICTFDKLGDDYMFYEMIQSLIFQ